MAGFSKTHKTCKYCGKGGFVWAKQNGQFKLAEPIPGTMQPDMGKLHQCLSAPQPLNGAPVTGQLGAHPNDQVRLTCTGCGTVILMRRADLIAIGAPICPKDETFYAEGVGVEHAAA